MLEYGYLRWLLQHLSHPELHEIMMNLSMNWPYEWLGKSEASS